MKDIDELILSTIIWDTHTAIIGAEAETHIPCILPSSSQAISSSWFTNIPNCALWFNI
jgi:hypothetical protein